MANKNQKESQFMFEIYFPREMMDGFGITDKEANFLYKLWKESSPGTKKFTSKKADNDVLIGLKSKGYVVGGEEFEFTEKGQKIIVEMVTNEPNSFSKKSNTSSTVSYSGIKSKQAANRREKQAFTKKKHANANPSSEPFNLRKESLKNMRSNNDD